MGGCGSGGGCGIGNAYNPGQYVGIRINEHEDGRSVLCDTMGIEVARSQRVIVEGDSGMEFAEVTNLRPMILKQCQLRDSRRLVRVASEPDLASYKAKVGRENRFLADTRRLAAEKRLAMKLVRAEESFDGRKVTVYYTSEARIDYRKLVSDLAMAHPVRIEMRQVGPRDETKMRGRHRPLRPDPLLLDVPEVLPPRNHQNGQEPESLAQSLEDLGDVRAPDVLPRLRGRGRQTGPPPGPKKPQNIPANTPV